MKAADISVGQIYSVKISGKLQQVRISSISTNGGWTAINLATDRQIRLRTGARVRPLPSTNPKK
ncbi:MAG: hypothetical protein FD167_322 [bacterium]|nr:MAG: hypothetical protein FD167_322 [bacterium]